MATKVLAEQGVYTTDKQLKSPQSRSPQQMIRISTISRWTSAIYQAPPGLSISSLTDPVSTISRISSTHIRCATTYVGFTKGPQSLFAAIVVPAYQ